MDKEDHGSFKQQSFQQTLTCNSAKHATSINPCPFFLSEEYPSTQPAATYSAKPSAHTFEMGDAEIAIIVGVFAILIAVLLLSLLVWKPNIIQELQQKFEAWKEDWKR